MPQHWIDPQCESYALDARQTLLRRIKKGVSEHEQTTHQ